MSSTVYFAGNDELTVLTNTFDVNGVPTDPATVTLTVTDPTGVQTIPATTRITTGKYTVTVASTLPGIWSYQWDGQGNPALGQASDIDAGTWTVSGVTLNRQYCSAEELKSRLGVPDTGDDFEVNLAVEAASRYVDEICGRYFWQGSDVRTYMPASIFGQQVDDIVSVTSFKVDFDGDGTFEQTWTQGTDFDLTVSPGHYNTTAKGEPWPYTGFTVLNASHYVPFVWPWSHQNRIQVTGVFGWPAVPATVKQAALLVAADLFKLKDAPLGVVGFGEFGAVKVTANPRVMQLLHRYCKGDRVGV